MATGAKALVYHCIDMVQFGIMQAVISTLEPLLQESERPPQDYTLEPWHLQLDQPSSSPQDATSETIYDATKLSQGSHSRIENMDTEILPR